MEVDFIQTGTILDKRELKDTINNGAVSKSNLNHTHHHIREENIASSPNNDCLCSNIFWKPLPIWLRM